MGEGGLNYEVRYVSQLRKRLCKGEPGTKVELECPKCGKLASVIIDADDLRISDKPLQVPTDKPVSARA